MRLASTIDSQTPSNLALSSPVPASGSYGDIPSAPVAITTPRSIFPTTTFHEKSTGGMRFFGAPAEDGDSLSMGGAGGRDSTGHAGKDKEIVVPNVKESFKRFVICHLAGLSAKLAVPSSGGTNGGGDERYGGNRAIGRSGKQSGGVQATKKRAVDSKVTLSPSVEALGKCPEQVRVAESVQSS